MNANFPELKAQEPTPVDGDVAPTFASIRVDALNALIETVSAAQEAFKRAEELFIYEPDQHTAAPAEMEALNASMASFQAFLPPIQADLPSLPARTSALAERVRYTTLALRDQRSINIQGALPDRIYTLIPSTIATCLLAAGVPREAFFMCRKFYRVLREYERFMNVHEQGGTRTVFSNGRVFASGYNMSGRAGVGSTDVWLTKPQWVRLPAVKQLWTLHNTCLAKTTAGLYGWGAFQSSPDISKPTPPRRTPERIVVDGKPRSAIPQQTSIFLRVGASWIEYTRCGPQPIPHSKSIKDWFGESFAWKDGQLVARGMNTHGQLGLMVGAGVAEADSLFVDYTEFRPVEAPKGIKPVDVIITPEKSTFFLYPDATYVCGDNPHSRLGVSGKLVATPVKLPIIADEVITAGESTLFRVEDEVYCAGLNQFRQMAPSGYRITDVTRMQLPWTPDRIALGPKSIFIEHAGKWYAKGDDGHSRLGIGTEKPSITGVGTLSEVLLPPGARVGGIAVSDTATRWLTDTGAFAAGKNANGELGIGTKCRRVGRPTRVRVPLNDTLRLIPMMTWPGAEKRPMVPAHVIG